MMAESARTKSGNAWRRAGSAIGFFAPLLSRRPWRLLSFAAPLIALFHAAACNRGDEPSEGATAAQAAAPRAQVGQPATGAAATDKVARARAEIDQVAARLDTLHQQAEAADGDRAKLVAVDQALQAVLADSRPRLAALHAGMSADEVQSVQAYYAERLGPVLSKLQVAVFPAHLLQLPQGATPAALPESHSRP